MHASTESSLLSHHSGCIPLANLDNEVIRGRSGRQVAISRSVGLVLKTFENEKACQAEVNIYQWLSLNSINCTPLFYGIYENTELGIPGMLLEYVGKVLQEEPSITLNEC